MNTAATRSATGWRIPDVVTIAVVCELVALAYSVAANIIDVRHDGWIGIGIGAFIPFWLIGGTYLLLSDRIARVWWGKGAVAWWANLAAALILIAPSASTSYWHQRELLLATHSSVWIATLLPLPVDGLVMRAALTLFRHAHATVASSTSRRQDDGPTPAGAGGPNSNGDTEPVAPVGELHDAPTDDPGLPSIDGVPDEVVVRAALLLDAEPRAGRPRLIEHLGVTDHVAKKLLRVLRPIRVVHSEGASAS